jgi:hypothetical protein
MTLTTKIYCSRQYVRSPKKINVHLCQKVPFVVACFQPSAAPRPENPDLDERDALFGLDTKITIKGGQC